MLLWMVLAVATGTQGIDVHISRQFGDGLRLRVDVVATNAEDAKVRGTLGALSTVHLDVWPGEWSITCEGKEVWCPVVSKQVLATPDSETLTLPLFRKAAITVSFDPPKGEPTPSSVLVNANIRPVNGPELHIVAREGLEGTRLQLLLPQSEFDLRFAFDRFAPVYVWRATARGRAVRDLGRFRLSRGGSVSGRAVDATTTRPLPGSAVRLTAAASNESADTRRLLDLAGSADRQGFFQLTGVPPGIYLLRVVNGDQEGRVESVEVSADAETALDDVMVGPLPSLTVAVRPATAPDDEKWIVHLAAREDPKRRRSVTAEAGGVASFGRVAMGRYSLIVETASRARMVTRAIDVFADQSITVELPIVRVQGTVRFGGKPLSATLTIEAGTGDHVALRSDESGRFSGWMREPSHGLVIVGIQSETPAVTREIRVADVAPLEGVLQMDLVLPDTRIKGVVIDEAGNPVDDATVHAESGPDDTAVGSTDNTGRFVLAGLRESTYSVWASDEGATTRAVEVDLASLDGLRELILILSRGRVVDASLVSAEGEPIRGAVVDVLFPGRPSGGRSARTDVTGQFRVTAPFDVVQAIVRVLAPSHFIWSACVDLPPSGPMVVRLPGGPAGELVVGLGPPRDKPLPVSPLVITQERGVIPMHAIASWLQMFRIPFTFGRDDAGQVALPPVRVAPGSYALVKGPPPDWLIAQQLCAGSAPASTWQAVPPGTRVQLPWEN